MVDEPASIETILYSFRRCPYAMRARMAIRQSRVPVLLREVSLKNKPQAMLDASPKATVPVLICNDDTVIAESLDIMHWALQQNDSEQYLISSTHSDAYKLIQYNDNIFKIHLDHYKYADRFPEHPQVTYRKKGEEFLQQLEDRLATTRYLIDDQPCITDMALFPFIRQFAYVDIHWFNQAPYPHLRAWLNNWLESTLFQSVMHKYTPWKAEDKPIIF